MLRKKTYFNAESFSIEYRFNSIKTISYFSDYLEEANNCKPSLLIQASKEDIEEFKWLVDKDEKSDAFREFQTLMLLTGNMILNYNCALFHGACFIWNNSAWIITAPSGTGKTTQLNHWIELYGKDISIINGDKPMIECKSNDTVYVYSSPWRGKERLGNKDKSAPLGGIILLEQSDHNEMCRLSAADAVLTLFIEFVSYPENHEQILLQSSLLEQILKCTPVWKLLNVGDKDSTILSHNILSEYLKEKAND